MSKHLLNYYRKLMESFSARAAGDDASEEVIMGQLDTLWLEMSSDERRTSNLVSDFALAVSHGEHQAAIRLLLGNPSLARIFIGSALPAQSPVVNRCAAWPITHQVMRSQPQRSEVWSWPDGACSPEIVSLETSRVDSAVGIDLLIARRDRESVHQMAVAS